MDAAVPNANRTNTIAQPINSGFPTPELLAGVTAGGGGATTGGGNGAGGGGWGAAGGADCTRWPQLPQKEPVTGEPQLVQNVGIGRFYRSEPRVTTGILLSKKS